MISGILLILLGIIAAPSLLLSRKPDAKELLEKITPYQGWIGVVFCIWGIWGIINSVLNLGWLTSAPIWWATYLAVSVVSAALGFLLGYGLINTYVLSKNPEAKERGEQLLAKLAPLQGSFGLAAIALGIWGVVASILFSI